MANEKMKPQSPEEIARAAQKAALEQMRAMMGHIPGMPDMGDMLDGPNALVFFREDPASAGKIIKNFAKENKALELKGGMIDKAVADTAMANAIADLPTREELLSTVLATMLNPMSQIARVVDLIREQKESEAA